MATCLVDVEPQSLFGVSCGRLITPGKGCPVHGLETEPAVLQRKSPDPDVVEAALAKIIEEV
jgi:hypothetical protein